MDIAMQYEKINLGYDRFVFKPIGVIKGTYDEKDDVFETELGVPCDSIFGSEIYSDNYFNDVTTIEELKKFYGTNLTENELLSEFNDVNMGNCYVGYFDEVIGQINAICIQFDAIEAAFTNQNINAEMSAGAQDMSDPEVIFTFDLEKLKELRNTATLDELREKLDEIINYTSAIEEAVKENVKKEEPKKLALKKEESKKFSLKELKKEVLSKIIAQDEAVNTVTTALAVNSTSKNPEHKSHILIAGPSGTGKTKMVSIISNELGLPCFSADSTAYTQEGYVGKSVYSMLEGLITAADGNIEAAQNGVLVIDEIDKKVSHSNSDVAGKAVLNSLLKIMDRGVIEIDIGGSYSGRKVMFDTSNLTVIFMGAFAELYDKKKKSSNTRTIGFGNKSNIKNGEQVILSNQDLIEYGIPPEFIGRIPTIAFTQELKTIDLLKILKISKISQIKIEQEYFNDMGIKVNFTYGYKKIIAEKAEKLGTGVRGLNKLIHESLINAYEEVLSNDKVKVLKITKQTALDNKKYYIE